MRVLLTGAGGFLGSHLLEALCGAHHEVSILLHSAKPRSISRGMGRVTVHHGSIADPQVLREAVSGVEAIVHCAGKTKALRASEFYEVNQRGTANLVKAANASRESLRHLVYLSSQAVTGPGILSRPARETDEPRPVSVYGHSKLLGEIEIRKHCTRPWTILRPAAAYGPGDTDFLPVFQQVKRGLMPLLSGAQRSLHMVYGPDVAAAVVCCLAQEKSANRIYHVAAEPPCTDRAFMQEIAAQLGRRPIGVRVPRVGLYLACVMQEALSRMRGRPSILSRRKIPELLAPGWVCSTERIRQDLGFTAGTSLREGVGRTLEWYLREGWMG